MPLDENMLENLAASMEKAQKENIFFGDANSCMRSPTTNTVWYVKALREMQEKKDEENIS